MEPQNYVEGGDSRPIAESGEFGSKREGKVARAIEQQTSKLPSDLFLWDAGASIIGSLIYQAIGTFGGRAVQMKQLVKPTRIPTAQFVGMWAPTFLILGVYNKLVKIAGSDRFDNNAGSAY